MYRMINIPLINKHFADLNPIDAGFERCVPNKSFGPYVRDYYLLHYIYKGSGIFKCPCGRFEVKKEQAFLIKPGEVTKYTADSDDPWEYCWIGFRGSLAEKFASLPPVIKLAPTYFYGIKELTQSAMTAKEEYLCARLFDIYCAIFGSRAENIPYEKQIKNYINANYMQKINMSDISSLTGLERSYLSRIFKKAEGMSPQEYLISLRLKKAKEFIENGYNISETALLCGYSDVFSLSKAFKKHLSLTPSEYKKSLSQHKTP